MGVSPDVHEHEATRSVGVLRITLAEAGLTEESGLLVAQVSRHGNLGAEGTILLRAAVNETRRLDLGQHGKRNVEELGHLLVPLEGLDVHEKGSGRVGHVGDMNTAVGASGDVPDDPCVDVAKEQFTLRGFFSGTRYVIEDPFDLGSRKIGADKQARVILHLPATGNVLTPSGSVLPFLAELLGPHTLPDDGIVNGFPRGLLPNNGSFALIRDADGRDLLKIDLAFFQRAANDILRAGPDFHGIMLNPTGLRINLRMFHLVGANGQSLGIEHHAARARRSLVNGHDIFLLRHRTSPPLLLSTNFPTQIPTDTNTAFYRESLLSRRASPAT